MRNGNLVKEKIEYYLERFKTKEGLFDFFVGTAIWGFLIITFTEIVKQFLLKFFSFFPEVLPFLGLGVLIQYYLTFLIYGILLSIFSVTITILLIKTFKLIIKFLKSFSKK